eukprot:2743843-Karenia_brevis.AAC.1
MCIRDSTISVNWYTSGPLANLLIAKQKQAEHAVQEKKPSGGAVWNAREQSAMQVVTSGCRRITTKQVKAAFKKAGVKPRCDAGQMRVYVKNYNTRDKAVADTKKPLLEQLRTHVSK